MKKFLLISMFFISVSSARAAQEHDPEIVFSTAAIQESLVVAEDVRAILKQLLKTREEVVALRKEENAKEIEELRAQLAVQGKNGEEIERAVTVLIEASVQEIVTFFDQQKINAKKRVKELLVLRAPTLLAEDPDLKQILKRG